MPSAITTRRRRDRWATAICRQDKHHQWARANHGTLWDYRIENESKADQKARLRKAQGLCFACPLRAMCREYHQTLTNETGEHMTGVWGGQIIEEASRGQLKAA
ncbi:Transcription factor WhiB [Nocardia amikacinitolerans]|uniref:Transcription factor WhiB n=1 Tax=Nocardia amikacinitolerans TaxID=756689 RepID=A0A285LGX1_9NOCA|nr:WhiB family transcriptional regulator [Nocardia amikacinitolerans]SNY84185.1 Transcription factor WhiB [Nocardia amikacinitolerans]